MATNCKYILDIKKVKPADIILIYTKGGNGIIIRAATGGDFSHAALCIGHSSCIHANSDGVHSDNLQRRLFDNASDVIILRYISQLPTNKIIDICNHSRELIGTQYGVAEAILSVSPFHTDLKRNRQFCSKLIAECYSHAKIPIVEDSNSCTPETLQNSLMLKQVEDVVRLATQEEVEFAATKSPLRIQTDATNYIFEKIRKLTNTDLQTFDQMYQYLQANPDYDSDFAKIIAGSGYLDFWQLEQTNCPYKFDADLWISMQPDILQLLDDVKKMYEIAWQSQQSIINTDKAIEDLNSGYNLKVFSQQLELNKNLTNMFRAIEETCLKIVSILKE